MTTSLKQIDLLLGESLELMLEAAKEIKKLSMEGLKKETIHIGRATAELWEVRNQIYNLNPKLKRDFVVEHSEDKQRYEYLAKIHQDAYEAEEKGEYEVAENRYFKLLQTSKYGYFKLLAESGLYRVTDKK